jgi:hypothetical protein
MAVSQYVSNYAHQPEIFETIISHMEAVLNSGT